MPIQCSCRYLIDHANTRGVPLRENGTALRGGKLMLRLASPFDVIFSKAEPERLRILNEVAMLVPGYFSAF